VVVAFDPLPSVWMNVQEPTATVFGIDPNYRGPARRDVLAAYGVKVSQIPASFLSWQPDDDAGSVGSYPLARIGVRSVKKKDLPFKSFV
ncbi:MAG: hypothetical protein ACREB2_14380, partial [Pseudolabrys sp.]